MLHGPGLKKVWRGFGVMVVVSRSLGINTRRYLGVGSSGVNYARAVERGRLHNA